MNTRKSGRLSTCAHRYLWRSESQVTCGSARRKNSTYSAGYQNALLRRWAMRRRRRLRPGRGDSGVAVQSAKVTDAGQDEGPAETDCLEGSAVHHVLVEAEGGDGVGGLELAQEVRVIQPAGEDDVGGSRSHESGGDPAHVTGET